MNLNDGLNFGIGMFVLGFLSYLAKLFFTNLKQQGRINELEAERRISEIRDENADLSVSDLVDRLNVLDGKGSGDRGGDNSR